jgi:LmbE family N-acetylglucosaminyl deacetylase
MFYQPKSIRITTFCFLISFFVFFNASAQFKSSSSSEIELSIQKLKTLGSVLYIAAHPDDENTRLLSYLSKERNIRTAYLSLTRGDGGQNLIGSEQGEMLGLTRTEELLAARSVDGAQQFFTRANDFGYSKNPEETFTFWDKQKILADVVYTIRKFKPDVIICRFPTTGEGGHGHHTASAILALEAYDLAADPKQFPEQLTEVSVWQAKRIFWNTFNFGSTNTTSPDQLKIDVGGFNTYLGLEYGEIAAFSRSMHKSQGFGSIAQHGSVFEYFKLLKGSEAKTDLMDDIVTNWERIKGGKDIESEINKIQSNFKSTHPEASVPNLIQLYKKLKDIKTKDEVSQIWLDVKIKELENIIVQCSGVWVEVTFDDYSVVPGQRFMLNSSTLLRSAANVKLLSIKMNGLTDTTVNSNLIKNTLFEYKKAIVLPKDFKISDPYWLRETHSLGLYTVNQQSMIGKPQSDPSFECVFAVEIEGQVFEVRQVPTYKFRDPVKGELNRPIEVLPAVTINPVSEQVIFPNNEVKSIFFSVKANVDDFKGDFKLSQNPALKVVIVNPKIELKKKGDEMVVEVKIGIRDVSFLGKVNASVLHNGVEYGSSIQRINYDHIPNRFVLKNCEVNLLKIDLKTTGTNIGYIEGAGDKVPEALMQIGFKVTLITEEMLKGESLQQYDAIITGVRAFNTLDYLSLYQEKLMAYVYNGGRFIVQYNTNSRVGPIQTGIGPYPFNITRNRVTDETAKVNFINPYADILNIPNKITEKDFDNWVQERGVYFAGDVDSNYVTVFSMKDPNEEENTGSLIMAQHGSGYFIYTGLSFFRQLPAGVPGAYRLFVNLLSQSVDYGKH